MIKIRVIMINDANIFTIYESLLEKVIKLLFTKIYQTIYRQFIKRKLKLGKKEASSGFKYKER